MPAGGIEPPSYRPQRYILTIKLYEQNLNLGSNGPGVKNVKLATCVAWLSAISFSLLGYGCGFFVLDVRCFYFLNYMKVFLFLLMCKYGQQCGASNENDTGEEESRDSVPAGHLFK